MTSTTPPRAFSILYVEDETPTREQLRRMLNAQGFGLIEATNGREGLDLYRMHKPDIVLADIMMPHMNGLEMAREIRAISPDAQVIITTAFSDTDYMLQAIDIGINQFVLKPISFVKLTAAIERCMNVINLQRELEKQNEHVRMLSNALEQSPSMALITDAYGIIEYANKKFCEITGFSASELLGKTPRMVKSGEMSPEFYDDLWSTIKGGTEWHGTMLNRRKNGDIYWEYASISPLKDQRGVPVKFIKTAEDITERKKQEAEDIRAQKMEAIGILAGGMAHDFNNLLQVILGYISVAKLHVNAPDKIPEMLDIAEKTSLRAKELSSRLLALAKGGDAFMVSAPLEPLITVAADAARTDTSVRLERSISRDLHQVLMDASQIRRVFSNLISNACEAMPHGGSLRITAENSFLEKKNPGSLPSGAYVHIAFHDNGSGISSENLPKIFDPYFTTKEMGSQKGMGLGLALCHSIIRNHKGAIIADSKPGEGSTFHIYLPAAQDTSDSGKGAA